MRAIKVRVPRIAPNFIQSDCNVPDCNDIHRAKGFCASHYTKWRKGVDVFAIQSKEQALINTGIAQERERIIKLLEENFSRFDASNNQVDYMSLSEFIAVIKGGNK